MAKGGRIATFAFVDASNIIYGAREEGWFIDQEKLFNYLKSKYNITKAFFYYGTDPNDTRKERFLKKLKSFGFILRVKEIKYYGLKGKANCDVDLTIDVMLNIDKYHRVVILSGDGDFLRLLKYLQNIGKEVIVIASPHRTAREVRKLVKNKFVNFDNLRYFIERGAQKKMGTILN